jgi:hypothetical protein
MELRCSPPVVYARHLSGELIEVSSRLSRYKHGGVLAVTGQGHIARCAAHVPRMVEIGLVQRAALPLVDRASVTVSETVELTGLILSPTVNETIRSLPLGIKA